jgi:hypothetical protein
MQVALNGSCMVEAGSCLMSLDEAVSTSGAIKAIIDQTSINFSNRVVYGAVTWLD